MENVKDYLEKLKIQKHIITTFTPQQFYSSKTGDVMDAGGIENPDKAKIFNIMENGVSVFTINFIPMTVVFTREQMLKQIQQEVMTGKRKIVLDDKIAPTELDWYNVKLAEVELEILNTTCYQMCIMFWNPDGTIVGIFNLSFIYSMLQLVIPSIYIVTEANGTKESILLYSEEGTQFIKKFITNDDTKFKQVVISGIEKYLYSFHK